ncbi:MAG TPA: DUF2752 domain-containing protein [Candidatus Dormibacteraeota bacterium]
MGSLSVVPAGRQDQVRMLAALGGLVLWLGYTRVFWTLHAVHATLPPCPFLFLTGQPCPLCGGTRAYAAMWQGDVAAAVRYHPLGPALFVGSLVAIAALAGLLATRRALRWSAGRLEERRALLALAAVFLAAWVVRLLLLPLPR